LLGCINVFWGAIQECSHHILSTTTTILTTTTKQQGTDFRFEDIRGVGHFVAGNNQRHLVPDKPMVVNINFRSHAGILNCASAFLDLLFDYFPGSVRQLKKDVGLFKGARPGVFQNVQIQQLSSLLRDSMQGAVILTNDESAPRWREALGHPLVYGIREAKGLEFKSVIILDFFGEIPSSLQKAWRNLLLGREGPDFELLYPLVETHLKLIYTAITRSIEQLFFAESTSSIAGNAAMRWLTTKATPDPTTTTDQYEAIATHNNVSNLESMMMTNDEFCRAGIDNAEQAESFDTEPRKAAGYLDRAIYCFDKAQNPVLLGKANKHLQSVQLRNKNNLMKSFTEDELSVLESEVAHLLEALIREDLQSECLRLLKNWKSLLLSRYNIEWLHKTAIHLGDQHTTLCLS